MLLKTSQKMGSLDSLDAVFDALVKVATRETKADRGSLFLHDDDTGELYSRVAQGIGFHEIRIMDTDGVAGAVFQSGVGEIVNDPYDDDRFNRNVDAETGYLTKSILCAAVKNAKGQIIGVIEVLNKKNGKFNAQDVTILEALAAQSSVTLQSMQLVENLENKREREIEFLNIVSEITSELELTRLLQRVIMEATRMLGAERSTLFINDDKTNELFSYVGEGLDSVEIRQPNLNAIQPFPNITK
jgi:adenylate cyclase